MSALDDCKTWVQEVVVGLNLCPFAAEPLRHETVGWHECASADFESQLEWTLEVLSDFVGADPASCSTSLLVFPNGLAVFEDYLDLLYATEVVLEDLQVDHLVQLASFHPEYVFEGAEADDPANATNRSPAPMLHFLRVDEVEEAIARHPDIESIPRRNAELMRQRGADG